MPCHSSTPKSTSKSSVIVYQGASQTIRAFNRWMSGCGARDTRAYVASRAFRCAMWATWSAIREQPTQPASGQPFTPGSKKKR